MIFVKDQKSHIVLMERIMAIFKLSSEALPSEETLKGFADPEGLISAMNVGMHSVSKERVMHIW